MAATPPTPRPPGAVARRWRGPFARWPRGADAVLALLVAGFAVLLQEGPGDTMVARDLGAVPVPVLAVLLVASLSVFWRRSHPLVVTGIGIVTMLVLLPSGYADSGATVAIGLYSTGRYGDVDRWGEGAVAAAWFALAVQGLVGDAPWGEVAFGVVFLAGAWLLGRSRRLRDERAAQWVREQAAEQQRIVADERTRIARELHDVVAHRVSLMTVQAGAAVTVAEHDPAAARRAMQAVEDAGRQALDELRHLLGVLRPEVDGAARDPQPDLGDLDRLVERVRDAGVAVDLEVDAPATLPARVQLSAHRIVQEALTNVLKHAGDGAGVQVRVVGTESGLEVTVADDGGAARTRAATPSGGHGIIGMRERAQLLGGRLDAGPTADGGYRVTAHLPATLPEPTEAP